MFQWAAEATDAAKAAASDALTALGRQVSTVRGDFNRRHDNDTGVRTRHLYMATFMSPDRPIGDLDTITRTRSPTSRS